MKQLLAILALLIASTLSAQLTPRSAFTTAPISVLPAIAEPTRLDMIDYFESGINRPSKTIFEGDAVLTALDDNIASISIGDYQQIDIVVLPYGNKAIIMIIDHLKTPDTTSTIRFYNSRWEQFDTDKMLRLPTLKDWTGKIDKNLRIDLENALPFIMYDAKYDPATKILTLKPETQGYVAIENHDLVDSNLKPELKYRWTGKKFASYNP
ncbi:MAG: DUF3256 family protein [Muribaculaceae bacterium]|nr:DUF3256 family protein [Muribaculaceae bacterium]